MKLKLEMTLHYRYFKSSEQQNGETIGNYLKVFFTDYYDLAKDDKVKTQHYIWTL